MWTWPRHGNCGTAILLLCVWVVRFLPGDAAVEMVLHSAPSSGSASPATPCVPVETSLRGLSGYVSWAEQERASCNETKIWILRVPPGHGTVLTLWQIRLRESSYLSIYRLDAGVDRIDKEEILAWTKDHLVFDIRTVKGGVMLKAEAPRTKHYPLSSFNISYEVYPLNILPRLVFLDHITDSTSIFNCSSGAVIPQAIACDGVKHCIDDQDEKDCQYRQLGCGDWVPYRDQCLKVEFILKYWILIGHSPPQAHTEANKACRGRYGATLASLPYKEGVDLVANLIYKSGFTSVSVNLRKVKAVSKRTEHYYRFLWQWGTRGSPIAYDQTDIQRKGTMFDCAVMRISPSVHFIPVSCYDPRPVPNGYVCMRPNPSASGVERKQTSGVHLQAATRTVHQFLTKRCEDGSFVHIFHQCQWKGNVLSTAWSPNHLPLFPCRFGPPIHYSLVCDGLEDCADGSDESLCLLTKTVSKKDTFFVCANHQVIEKYQRCDGIPHCFDGTDELDCSSCQGHSVHCWGVGCVPISYIRHFQTCSSAPLWTVKSMPSIGTVSVVQLDGYGMSNLYNVDASFDIVETLFQCSNGLHIPTFLLNNGEQDCVGGEDEDIPPENFTCPGFYRCQDYGNCLHADLVCDSIPHCPNQDDERYCNMYHPSNCTCEGYACSCHTFPWPVSDFWHLRYLDLSGVENPPVSELVMLDFLQFLNISFCALDNITLVDMPQLEILDLSYNALSEFSSMVVENLVGLTHLNISGNPLVSRLDAAFSSFLTHAGLINVQHLVMTNTGISQIEDNSFRPLLHLVSLDLRDNKLKDYDKGVFSGLRSLQHLQTDESSLCCLYFYHELLQCSAPTDELSSCSDLLRLDFFRVFLWSFSSLTVIGNSGVLIYKVVTRKQKKLTSFRVLVSHLTVADLLMGVYMAIIGAADVYFRGSYVVNESLWRQGSFCLIAGFLAFVSSELSVFIICLITLDRLLVVCFPFKNHLHPSAATSMKLCCLAWLLGILLASVPLIGRFEFYGESSVCLPLPITRHQFSGQMYSFLVFIVMNFLLFVFIGIGQLAIYWSVRRTRRAVKSSGREEDTNVAQRLFLVVFTDFCCWFPVGLMGLLAFSGFPIPGVVSVWVAVFVLPINSALNPFLYTFSSLWEKWNQKKMVRKSKLIMGNLKREIPKFTADFVEELMLTYLGSNRRAKLEKVFTQLRSRQELETGLGDNCSTLNDEKNTHAT